MGLDITAYRQLRLVENPALEDGDPVDPNHWKPYINPGFPGRAEGIAEGAVYEFSECMGFSAGSYFTYSFWRNELARRAGYPADPAQRESHRHSGGAWQASGGPFFELINFSDCEGTIGPIVAAKIARDFAEHEAEILQATDRTHFPAGYFAEQYGKWRRAFEMAADGGAVSFH